MLNLQKPIVVTCQSSGSSTGSGFPSVLPMCVYDPCWLILVDSEWPWLILVDPGWPWLILRPALRDVDHCQEHIKFRLKTITTKTKQHFLPTGVVYNRFPLTWPTSLSSTLLCSVSIADIIAMCLETTWKCPDVTATQNTLIQLRPRLSVNKGVWVWPPKWPGSSFLGHVGHTWPCW